MSIYTDKASAQNVYDAYNEFIFSQDRNVFFKLVKRIELFNMIKHLPGDIIECGVFKGSGMMVWAKLLNMYTPHDIRKVIGFDYFSREFVADLPENDKQAMKQVFTRCDTSRLSLESVRNTFENAGVPKNKYELIQGDISVTSAKYVENNPGMRISLLYMDLDLDKPTYDTLTILWNRVVPGGIVVFDEYGYGVWTESNAVDKFVEEMGLRLYKIDLQAPTAYIVKP